MKKSIGFLSLVGLFSLVGMQNLHADESRTVVDNGKVQRRVVCSSKHVLGEAYMLEGDGRSFMNNGSREFSFLANDSLYTGASNWKDVQFADTVCSNGGKGTLLTMVSEKGDLKVELLYLSYPDLPLIRKTICVTNLGKEDVKIEAVNVEDFSSTLWPTGVRVMRGYGRYETLGPYEGNWDDPLVVLHDWNSSRGIALGNEAIGILKRTSVLADGSSVRLGVTTPSQDYPFRRWLTPGKSWKSAAVFTAPYTKERDPERVMEETVQAYIRKYMGVRIEQIEHKPMFVYNTWVPFRHNINEDMMKEVIRAAADCGIEEFIIDDGWQTNHGSGGGSSNTDSVVPDWDVDTSKFPHGLKPIFDYIKSLGMKPGLWLCIARLDKNSETCLNHPEWFIVNKDGQLSDLHTGSSANYTACMAVPEWCEYIRETILKFVRAYGIQYVKLDLSILTSAYVYDPVCTGCYATNHGGHRDHAESYDAIYEQCMELFDQMHAEIPDLFIDCTFETAGKLQLMDYGIARHAEGNWLANVEDVSSAGAMRVRHLAWGRTPALPASSLVIGNLRLDNPQRLLSLKSLAGTLPIMLGDPRSLSAEERAELKKWAKWFRGVEDRHGFMSFRQDLPGFGAPTPGCWDGYSRLNVDTKSGGLVGVFREGAAETTRTVSVRGMQPDATYQVRKAPEGFVIRTLTGAELESKGFSVEIANEYDGEVFEIIRKD